MVEKLKMGLLEMSRRISIRWKVLQALGAVLIALGIFIDWAPPQEPSLPDTSSFLVLLGGLLSAAGLFTAFQRD